MMTLVFGLLLFANSAQSLAIGEVRQRFYQATDSEKACRNLITSLGSYTARNNPLLSGYKGAATMVMAKHAVNPFTKLSYFKNGRNILEQAIVAERNSTELRFLRYTVQDNIPAILGYKSNLEEDRKFIERSLPSLKDQELKKIIAAYLKEKG